MANPRPTSAANHVAVDEEVLAVASRIASMADREVRQRYHELVDKRLGSELTVLERFELERIETRLDAEDRDPEIEARDRQWEMERTQLLESIGDLLLNLRR
jgi:2-methylcitrate dehydratase PrpD